MYFCHDDPPSENPAVDSKLLDVVIHLAASVGRKICNNYSSGGSMQGGGGGGGGGVVAQRSY